MYTLETLTNKTLDLKIEIAKNEAKISVFNHMISELNLQKKELIQPKMTTTNSDMIKNSCHIILGLGNMGKQVIHVLSKNNLNVKSLNSKFKDKKTIIHFCKHHDYPDFNGLKDTITECTKYTSYRNIYIYNYSLINKHIMQKFLINTCNVYDMMIINNKIIKRPKLDFYISYYLTHLEDKHITSNGMLSYIVNNVDFKDINLQEIKALFSINAKCIKLGKKYINDINFKYERKNI